MLILIDIFVQKVVPQSSLISPHCSVSKVTQGHFATKRLRRKQSPCHVVAAKEAA
ncbi:hypothetical protein KUV61_12365 [Nocardioides marinus]|nr:hypothetical protein [Nocardioides marinus]